MDPNLNYAVSTIVSQTVSMKRWFSQTEVWWPCCDDHNCEVKQLCETEQFSLGSRLTPYPLLHQTPLSYVTQVLTAFHAFVQRKWMISFDIVSPSFTAWLTFLSPLSFTPLSSLFSFHWYFVHYLRGNHVFTDFEHIAILITIIINRLSCFILVLIGGRRFFFFLECKKKKTQHQVYAWVLQLLIWLAKIYAFISLAIFDKLFISLAKL